MNFLIIAALVVIPVSTGNTNQVMKRGEKILSNWECCSLPLDLGINLLGVIVVCNSSDSELFYPSKN